MAVVDAVSASTEAPSFNGIFPLPLTTFEHLMVVDATTDYPMVADLELHFQGRIERPAFDRALAFALERNPLFACLLVRDGEQGWNWIASELSPRVDWATIDVPIAGGYGAQIDLTRELGLKLWVRCGAERSTVLLHFHHACADGVGAYAFIEDFLVGYNSSTSGAAPVNARPLEPARLKSRGAVPATGRSLMRRVFDPVLGAAVGLRFFAEAPLVLPGQVGPEDAAGQAVFLTRTCPREVVAALRRSATQAGATCNDLLIRDLMVTLRRWHEAGGRTSRRRRLRILMPQNLRGPDDARMPACNALSFAFITRKIGECDAPDRLLASIARETSKVRKGMLSAYFLGGVAAALSLGILPWVLRQRICFSTAVLSNLGDSTRRFVARFPRRDGGLVVGNLTFLGVTGGPPLRASTRASLAVTFAGGSMTVCLKCDPLSYGPLDTQRLLDAYIDQLRASAATVDEHAAGCAGISPAASVSS